jgi:anaerobic dimethyl sulfoxide reductase subunit A
MTSSAAYADILLPAPSFLESPNIVGPFSEGDYLLHSNPLIPPLGECREEYDWLKELADRIGHGDAFRGTSDRGSKNETLSDWLRTMYNTFRSGHDLARELPSYEEFRDAGGHFYEKPTTTVAFADFVSDPAAHPLPSPSGLIELFSPALAALGRADVPPLPVYTPGFENSADPRAADYPFQLLGYQSTTRTHSVHGNNPNLADSPVLAINPLDAAALEVEEGTPVRLFNDRGSLTVPAHVTGDIMRGVVSLPAAAWYTPAAGNANLNVLTTLTPTPLAKGNAQHSILVANEKA